MQLCFATHASSWSRGLCALLQTHTSRQRQWLASAERLAGKTEGLSTLHESVEGIGYKHIGDNVARARLLGLGVQPCMCVILGTRPGPDMHRLNEQSMVLVVHALNDWSAMYAQHDMQPHDGSDHTNSDK